MLSPEERDELRSTARSLLSRQSSPAAVRAVVGSEWGFDADLWATMVELGWTGIHVAEEHGGAGCGLGDLAVVLHELGRAITPGPFLPSAVLATTAFAHASNGDAAGPRLAALAAGEAVGTVAFAGSAGAYEHSRLDVMWRADGAHVRLDGVAGFVLHADAATEMVVVARGGDGALAMVAVDPRSPGVDVAATPCVDETRRMARVSFADVAVPVGDLLCEPGPEAERLAGLVLAAGVVAAGCDATGVAERVLEVTARYATERMQFGKPIGSFQAVKHHCANMAISVEASRAATRAAADQLDGDPAGWAATAAVTASYVGPACAEACALGLLVHGGIGFTWEHDAHLYLKRAKLDEVLFGTPAWYRRRLADLTFPGLVTARGGR